MSPRLSPEHTAELRTLAKAATRGPWTAFDRNGTRSIFAGRPKTRVEGGKEIVSWSGFDQACTSEQKKAANLQYIVAACNVLPAALDDITDLTTANADLTAQLAAKDAEIEAGKNLVARLIMEAQIWSGEARVHKSTVHEAYQAVSGATGEPGNWNGAVPIVNALRELRERADKAEAALKAATNGTISEAMVEAGAAAMRKVGWEQFDEQFGREVCETYARAALTAASLAAGTRADGLRQTAEIKHVSQEDRYGCVVACLAAVRGVTYEEVRDELGSPGTGFGYHVWEAYLSRHGYALQNFWIHDAVTKAARAPWPLTPWSDVILCTAGAHMIVARRDGSVLDPAVVGPRRLSDYSNITQMSAVVRAELPTDRPFPCDSGRTE